MPSTSRSAAARTSWRIELDGFAYHGSRQAFTYDRLRQNDLIATGRSIVRFSYDSIRTDTARCVDQLQAVLRLDPLPGRRCSLPTPTSRCPRWIPTHSSLGALAANPQACPVGGSR